MASIDGNGGYGFQEPGHGMDPRANGDAGPASGTPLDPSHIGRLVEREVATMLEAAQVEADRISATAMGVVRKAEAKIAALQLELDAAVVHQAAGEPPGMPTPDASREWPAPRWS